MEFIAEILLHVLAWLFEIAAEFLVQIVFEGLAELLGHAIKSRSRRTEPVRAELAALGHVALGAACGAASLWLVPSLFIRTEALRFVNLAVTPLACGAVMGWAGAWRRRHGKDIVRLESFAYGFCFAFSMAVVRLVFGS
jgi:hypothetical protein